MIRSGGAELMITSRNTNLWNIWSVYSCVSRRSLRVFAECVCARGCSTGWRKARWNTRAGMADALWRDDSESGTPLSFHIYRQESLTSSLLYSRERMFCKLRRDTRISYFLSKYPTLISYSPSRKRRVTPAHFITTYASNVSNFPSRACHHYPRRVSLTADCLMFELLPRTITS